MIVIAFSSHAITSCSTFHLQISRISVNGTAEVIFTIPHSPRQLLFAGVFTSLSLNYKFQATSIMIIILSVPSCRYLVTF